MFVIASPYGPVFCDLLVELVGFGTPVCFVDQSLNLRDRSVIDRTDRFPATLAFDCAPQPQRLVGKAQRRSADGAVGLGSDVVQFVRHSKLYHVGDLAATRRAAHLRPVPTELQSSDPVRLGFQPRPCHAIRLQSAQAA